MATITFDTFENVKRLKAVGFTEEQAAEQTKIISELMENRLATKQDIVLLQRDIKELELRLKHDLTLRMGGMLAATIAIVAALVKLL
jgi:predicted phage-related endonuclease